MANEIFGEIYNPCKEVSIEWKIDNYFSLPQKADSYIDSPTFHGLNASWHLRLYPNGIRNFKSVEYLNLYLFLTNSSEIGKISVNIVLGVRSGNGKTYVKLDFNQTFDGNAVCDGVTLLERNELWRNRGKIAPDGAVTLFAVVKQSSCFTDASSQTASVNGNYLMAFCFIYITSF